MRKLIPIYLVVIAVGLSGCSSKDFKSFLETAAQVTYDSLKQASKERARDPYQQ